MSILQLNKFETNSYLDPSPINLTQCQSLIPQDFSRSRHIEVWWKNFNWTFDKQHSNFKGCQDKIEYWYREQYIILLCAGLVLALVEFFVLLSIVLNCTHIKQNRLSHKIPPVQLFNEERSSHRTDSFQRNTTRQNIYEDDFISVTPEIREVFVQPADLNKHKYPPTKFHSNNYRLTNNAYLI